MKDNKVQINKIYLTFVRGEIVPCLIRQALTWIGFHPKTRKSIRGVRYQIETSFGIFRRLRAASSLWEVDEEVPRRLISFHKGSR